MMFDIVNHIGDKLVTRIQNSLSSAPQRLEMHDIVARFTTDVISSVAFGLDSDSLNNENSPIRKYGKDVVDMKPIDFVKFHFSRAFPGLSRKFHLTVNKPDVIDFFYNTFRRNIEERENSEVMHRDFLQILLELKKSSTLGVDELAAESFIFFLGGEYCIIAVQSCEFECNTAENCA